MGHELKLSVLVIRAYVYVVCMYVLGFVFVYECIDLYDDVWVCMCVNKGVFGFHIMNSM